jgi:bifunctional non-homologous end joining protein LigD
MNEIAEGAARRAAKPQFDLNGAPKAAIPHHIRPMLAFPASEPFDHPDWLFEVKWDGYRAIAEIHEDQVRLYSRNLLAFEKRFAPVVDSLEHLGQEAVIDGELVVLDKSGRPKFQLIQDYPKSGGSLVYLVFDLLYLAGHNLEKLPLVRRKEILAKLVHGLPNISLSEHVPEQGKAFYRAVEEKGLEGIVAKDGQSRYRQGVRSRSWLKIKTHLRQEAVIAGFTEPQGSRQGFGALVLGVYENGDLAYIGHVGTGFSQQLLADLRSRLDPLIQETCPFKKRPKVNGPFHWVRPQLVCEVSFDAWTNDGYIRHPVYLGLREDKEASAVRREQPLAKGGNDEMGKQQETTPPSPRPRFADSPTPKASGNQEISGQQVHLTNLDKVYWPEDGYTKGDLIRYYREVSEFILPYLRDRPESLNRHPNGIHEKNFFQKDLRRQPPPDWVQTLEVASEDKKLLTVLCQDEASLAYLANLGCIELNPWHARVGSLDQADYLVLDLDPEAIAFDQVVAAAQAIRKVLDQIGAESCCKTSGKRGLHIYVPFGARYGHDQAKQFAELIARVVNSRLPSVTSLIRDPKRRQGKVYLDYLQNGKGKTLAAAYSVRPRPKATVSTPLKWTEVRRGLDPTKFTIRTLPKRLNAVGDLWQPVLGPGIDLAACLEKLLPLLKRETA